jgi:hypothetical protein
VNDPVLLVAVLLLIGSVGVNAVAVHTATRAVRTQNQTIAVQQQSLDELQTQLVLQQQQLNLLRRDEG